MHKALSAKKQIKIIRKVHKWLKFLQVKPLTFIEMELMMIKLLFLHKEVQNHWGDHHLGRRVSVNFWVKWQRNAVRRLKAFGKELQLHQRMMLDLMNTGLKSSSIKSLNWWAEMAIQSLWRISISIRSLLSTSKIQIPALPSLKLPIW